MLSHLFLGVAGDREREIVYNILFSSLNRDSHTQVARQMKNEECFYYPHNIDFRGRAYPMHPHLNHLGSDMCRGLLEFAEGHPLGKTGFHWLKIHLANVYGNGVDKFSFEGRLAFVEKKGGA